MNWRTTISILKETGLLWSRKRANRMSAALAYYTVLSLSPLLLIAVTVAGLAYGATAAESELIDQIRQVAGAQVSEAVQGILLNSSHPQTGLWATVLSVVILLYGASNIFDQLQEAMNTIWGVPHIEEVGLWKFVQRRLYAIGLVLSVGLLLVLLILVSTVLSVLSRFLADQLPPSFDLLHWIDLLLSGILLSVIFAFLFKVLPDIRVQWRDVWGGGLLTAVLFAISKYLIGLYFGHTSITSAYGAAGSLAIVLIWVYFAGQIFFLGAAYTKAYANWRQKGEEEVREQEDLTADS